MNYFSFQGPLDLADRLPNGRPGKLGWMGDVYGFNIKFSEDTEDINESYTGTRGLASSLGKGLKAKFELKCRYATGKNLALSMRGTVIDVPAGTVTGETFPTGLIAGDRIMLNRRDISQVLLTDSTDKNPKPLVLGQDYAIDSGPGGKVKLLKVDGFVQPFVGGYAYGASRNVVAFRMPSVEKYGVFEGINTLDNSRMRAQIYRMKFDPVSDLSLITDSHGDLNFSGSLLFDVVNATNDEYGGYLRFEMPSDA